MPDEPGTDAAGTPAPDQPGGEGPASVLQPGQALVRADRDHIRVEGDGSGGLLYWLLRNIVLGPVIKRVFSPVEEGVSNIPAHGPAIIAANHLSYADWLFIPLALRRRITFVAKADYWQGRGLKAWWQRKFFAGTGQVPIDRSGGSASEAALEAGLRILRRGELFGIFPEGTRSLDGRLYKGRTGMARLAIIAQVPIIPAALIGTDTIAPTGRILSRIMSPTVRFGTPINVEKYRGRENDRSALRALTDQVMQSIQQLGGQTYVDSYAPSKSAAPGETSPPTPATGGTAEG